MPLRLPLLLAVLLAAPASAQLSGTYTIDDAPGAAADFASLDEAFAALEAVGVSGEVTLALEPGLYVGQADLTGPIAGAGPTARVTVTGPPVAPGAAPLATLRYDATVLADNYVVRLDDVSFVTFRHLGFDASQGATNLGRAFHITGDVSWLTFEGNRFRGPGQVAPVGPFLSANVSLLYMYASVDEAPEVIRIARNVFEGGGNGVHFDFVVGNPVFGYAERIYVQSNYFIAQEGAAISSRRVRNVVISDNEMYRVQRGVELFRHRGGLVTRNQVLSEGIGMSIGQTNQIGSVPTDPEDRFIMSNNMISSDDVCLNLYVPRYMMIAHNTMLSTMGVGYKAAFQMGSSYASTYISEAVKVKGNIVVAGEAQLIEFWGPGLEASDSNVFYDTDPAGEFGEVYGVTHTTLADYQAATGFDAHSLVHPVTFAGFGDLRLAGPSIGDDLLGVSRTSEVLVDVEFDSRPRWTYAGADEAGVQIYPPAPRMATSDPTEEPAVSEVSLSAPVPNPSASGARVAFALPEAGPARLAVHDARGRELAVLADGTVGPGRHEVRLPGDLPAGVYLVRLEAGGTTLTQRAAVVR